MLLAVCKCWHLYIYPFKFVRMIFYLTLSTLSNSYYCWRYHHILKNACSLLKEMGSHLCSQPVHNLQSSPSALDLVISSSLNSRKLAFTLDNHISNANSYSAM